MCRVASFLQHRHIRQHTLDWRPPPSHEKPIDSMIRLKHIFGLGMTLALLAGAICIAATTMPSTEGVRTANASLGPNGDNYGYGRTPEAVDLGLSVMWADHNVGANHSNEIGRFFGYGDVDGNETSNFIQRYATGDISGTEHDPAYSFWGQGWRMPTSEEMTELCERCSWKWVKKSGVNGFLVTGKRGQSIFLPVTGMKSNGEMQFEGVRGYYWTGETSEGSTDYAYTLFFYKGGKLIKNYKKFYGFVIRPVKEEL